MQEGRPKKDDSDVLVGAMEKLVQHSQCDSERKRRKTIIQKKPKSCPDHDSPKEIAPEILWFVQMQPCKPSWQSVNIKVNAPDLQSAKNLCFFGGAHTLHLISSTCLQLTLLIPLEAVQMYFPFYTHCFFLLTSFLTNK